MARKAKVVSRREIELIVDKKVREVLQQCRVMTNFVAPGKRGRPFGFSPKKSKVTNGKQART